MSARLAPSTKLRQEFSASALLLTSQLSPTLTYLGLGNLSWMEAVLVVGGEAMGWELGRILEIGEDQWSGGGIFEERGGRIHFGH